jgi:divalent metal cation (Fe/Co/Zn/Cd) transporter
MVSLRGARLYRSDALFANALHFGSDFAGTIAVLAGLIAAALDVPAGDSIAALFVSGLVVAAAARLASRNVDVLMDRSPEDETRIARRAIATLDPPVELRRLRLRRAGGEHFADVVIGVAPAAAIGQGHAAADRVEEALHAALPGIDVVVHVEPQGADSAIRERVLAAALTVSRVREIHNLTVLDVHGSIEVSLHVKLPGDLPLDRAHEIAEQVEAAILTQVAEVRSVQTHLEPIGETASGEEVDVDTAAIEAAVREETGVDPRELRFVRTDDGIVVFLTLGLPTAGSLADAHGQASAIERRVRRAVPTIADVVVHTEP